MNKIFRSIWSDALGTFVAVAEIVSTHGRGSGKRGRLRLPAASLLLTLWICGGTAVASTLPTGGTIVAGSGSIATSGNTMTVTQDTQRMAADWTSFSIGQNNSVNFQQPSSSAVALNRVTGADASVIQGALNANGQVFLINPNGVLFSSTAQVNVGALVASTLNISNDDFMAGNYRFAGHSSNAIVNQGNITTHDGGTIALIAARIDNSGTLTANGGQVLMGAGSKVTLDLGGPVKIQVEEAAIDALIEQGGAIKADGGLVYLTARAAGELAGTVINHTGISEAQTLATGENGQIYLMGDMDNGRVEVAGTLDASAPNGGDGGFVETSAAYVQIHNDVQVSTLAENGKTGLWLIDPNDFTIAASGGDMTAATVVSSLASTNFEIQTATMGTAGGSGNIYVNEDITWSNPTTLTLTAENEVHVNATIKNTNTTNGGVYFNAANVEDKVIFDANGLVSIYNVYQLQWMNQALNGKYVLGGNIDASATSTWDSDAGFVPIGTQTNQFSGSFDGQEHTIDSLYINRPSTSQVGLFGRTNTGATIKNVGLTNATTTAQHNVGTLVGQNYGSITNAYATGNVSGQDSVGGLVGNNYGSITNVYATGNVSGTQSVGGLAGYHRHGSITSAYATGNVSGTNNYVGGLVGWTYNGTITNAYATGNVSSTNDYVGGLVGFIQYSTFPAGYSSSITNAYATGNVSGTSKVGGLVGENFDASINNSFWDTQTSGTITGVAAGANTGVTGKTTEDMMDASTYAGWDTDIWTLNSGAKAAGYALGGLPYLTNVTRTQDIVVSSEKLFEGGFGTVANPYTITDWTQLQNINYNSDVLTNGYYFTLSNNLNNATAGYTNSGEGWLPIGNLANEVIHHRGPWKGRESVEYATLEWVNWFNNRRLLEPIGNIPPAEREMEYYRLEESSEAA